MTGEQPVATIERHNTRVECQYALDRRAGRRCHRSVVVVRGYRQHAVRLEYPPTLGEGAHRLAEMRDERMREHRIEGSGWGRARLQRRRLASYNEDPPGGGGG